ncbi:MAG: AAA family ATPase [Acidimicrobiales bacterium]
MSRTDEPHTSVDQIDAAILFTDIEGSTARWDADALAMREQLARHDAVVTDSILEHGGHVVKHTGDGFLARFETGRDATAAAISAQLRLADMDFSSVGGLKIRAAIDVGVVETRNGDLYGPALNRCARLMDAAHGGQVLASEYAWEDLHVGESLRAGERQDAIDFADLGLHRLKGLARPQRIFQVLHSQLPQAFPPPRSLNSSIGNLPVDASPVVGRADLISRVAELLAAPGVVTLIGPGGVGKTRLAISVGHEVAGRFADGVWFVDLAPVNDRRGMSAAVIRSMGLARRSGQTLESTLRDVLSSRQALLIIDNAEHLVDATRDLVSQVLVHGSTARVLVTSRLPLGGSSETKIRVEPLVTPKGVGVRSLDDALLSPAVQLFVERARSARADFALTSENFNDVVAICDELDGLPLAIELAAARVEVMTIAQISARLDDRFRLLQAGPEQDSRHRTLIATLDWSYEHLSPGAQGLFARLSVLASSFSFDTAAALATMDELDVIAQLAELVQNSMLATDHNSEAVRYRMIETMRDYAALRLDESGDTDEVQRRHAAYFSEMAASLQRVTWGREALGTLDQCRLELPSLRRAFEWALANDPAQALAMATDLYALWLIRDLVADGRRWLHEVSEVIGGTGPTLSRELIAALDDAGTLAWMMGNTDDAVRYLEAALEMADEIGVGAPPKALVRLGSIRSLAGNPREGLRLCNLARSLALNSDADPESLVVVERTLGAVLALSGDPVEGAAICEHAITRARETDLWLASALTNLTYATSQLNPSRAIEASLEAISEAERIGSKYYQGSAWAGLGLANLTLGNVEAGCRAYAESLTHMLDSGARQSVFISLFKLSDALISSAPAAAVTLTAGAAKIQQGPGADGTWHDAMSVRLRALTRDSLTDDVFAGAWDYGTTLSVDAMVTLARETVDETWSTSPS